MASVGFRNLQKSYRGASIIEEFNLDIADGEFLVFVGPSGCGKSTLIRMIAGLEEISGGDLLIDGARVNDVGPAERGLAMVFQSYALYPHMTVRENMGFALRLARTPPAEREVKVMDAARILHLEKYLDKKPGQLSGGQRQRVAIGRAIVRNPKIFLFDEPLSNLDAALRGQMRVQLAQLHADLGATMIYVTHDQVEAMTMADRIVVLRDGRIEQVGTPLEIYRHPANLFVAGFIGSPQMSLLPGTAARKAQGGFAFDLPGSARLVLPVDASGLAAGAPVTVGIRPEALRPTSGGVLNGVVRLVEQLGASSLVHADLDGASCVAQIAGSDAFRSGDAIQFAVDPAGCHVFDNGGRALAPLSAPSVDGRRT